MPTNSLLSWNDTLTSPPSVTDSISRLAGPILDWNGAMDSQFGKTGALLPNNFVDNPANVPATQPMSAGSMILMGIGLYSLYKIFR